MYGHVAPLCEWVGDRVLGVVSFDIWTPLMSVVDDACSVRCRKHSPFMSCQEAALTFFWT
jgi:hypothetical protein